MMRMLVAGICTSWAANRQSLTRRRREAAAIGEVTAEHPSFVLMKTRVGGTRVVDMLSSEQLPRIC
jgi:hydrogenase maturation factor